MSLIPCEAVKCEAHTAFTYFDEPFVTAEITFRTPIWTLKVMSCGSSTLFSTIHEGHIQNQELLYDNFLFISIKLHSKVMNAVSDHFFEYCKYKQNPPYCLIIQSKLKV